MGIFCYMNIKIFKNNAIFSSILAGIMLGFCVLGITMPKIISADFENIKIPEHVATIANNSKKIVKTINVIITAYSSTPDQTDDTPFITASGKYVRDGIIANNLLPFGTKVRIPELYGDKVFVVEDRMNKKKGNYHVDIWMETTPLAKNFGAKTAKIEVLEN